jgi:rubrerythrin
LRIQNDDGKCVRETEITETERLLGRSVWCCDTCDEEFQATEPPICCPSCGLRVRECHRRTLS